MAKLLSFSDESRAALERGMNALADAVRVTIGPRGRNVVLEKSFGAPDIINDGDTIAKEIELEDPFENIGAKLIQQVASKTKDKAGDGTTTATVLAQAMVEEGLRNTAAGASPIELRRGMEAAVEHVRRSDEAGQPVQIVLLDFNLSLPEDHADQTIRRACAGCSATLSGNTSPFYAR